MIANSGFRRQRARFALPTGPCRSIRLGLAWRAGVEAWLSRARSRGAERAVTGGGEPTMLDWTDTIGLEHGARTDTDRACETECFTLYSEGITNMGDR